MKWIKVFLLFCIIHISGWGASHYFLTTNPREIVVIIDTSYAMKPRFPAMQEWLEEFQATSRYQRIIIGTDKALLGDLDNIKSLSSIFRTAFGRVNPDTLRQRYSEYNAKDIVLLSDGDEDYDEWRTVSF